MDEDRFDRADDTDDDDRPDEGDVRAGRSPGDISEGEKYEFLQLVRQGLNRSAAAQVLGYYGRHFRALTAPLSIFYDEDFSRDYAIARGSLEHAEGRLERLRDEADRRALQGSDRLLEKLLMVHDPEWKVLREKNVDVEVNVRHLVETHFAKLPAADLEKLLLALDAGDEVPVDAEYTEIGPGDTVQ